MIEVDYMKTSFKKVNALKSYKPKNPPERYFFEHVKSKTLGARFGPLFYVIGVFWLIYLGSTPDLHSFLICFYFLTMLPYHIVFALNNFE